MAAADSAAATERPGKVQKAALGREAETNRGAKTAEEKVGRCRIWSQICFTISNRKRKPSIYILALQIADF